MPERTRKTVTAEQRKRDILDAALAVFTERGYAATRIEDIAARAGIGKGTLYLHFSDKQAVFSGLVSGVVSPLVSRLEAFSVDESIAPRDAVSMLYALVDQHILKTPRLHIIRLLFSEGQRFPALADFYYDHVVAPGLRALRQLLRRAVANGDLRNPAVADLPQLVMAPLLTTVLWGALFERRESLDSRRMFETMLDTLFLPPQGDRP